MEILPLHPAENAASPDALRGFLAQCRDAAERDRHDKLVSISMALPPPDPLAALKARAAAAGLVEGTPEYREFMLRNGAVGQPNRMPTLQTGEQMLLWEWQNEKDPARKDALHKQILDWRKSQQTPRPPGAPHIQWADDGKGRQQGMQITVDENGNPKAVPIENLTRSKPTKNPTKPKNNGFQVSMKFLEIENRKNERIRQAQTDYEKEDKDLRQRAGTKFGKSSVSGADWDRAKAKLKNRLEQIQTEYLREIDIVNKATGQGGSAPMAAPAAPPQSAPTAPSAPNLPWARFK